MAKWNKWILFALCLCLSILPVSAAEDVQPESSEEIRVEETETAQAVAAESVLLHIGRPRAYVKGEEKRIDPDNAAVMPFEEDDRTFLPVRFLAEALGAQVDWDEDSQTATVKKDGDTVEVTIGSDRIRINGKVQTIDAAARTKDNRTFLPVRAVAEALGQKVTWDPRGLVTLGNRETLPKEIADEFAEGYFKPNSSDIVHPFDYTAIQQMLVSSHRTIVRQDAAARAAEAEPYMKMELEDIGVLVDTQTAGLADYSARPGYERVAAVMSINYDESNVGEGKDEEIAKRVITMLYHGALGYDKIPNIELTDFGKRSTALPGLCVFAYDRVYNSPYWEELSEQTGTDARKAVEEWFLKAFDYSINLNAGSYYDNRGAYWLKNAAGIALIVNDPDRMRQVISALDTCMTGYEWHADGMWSEGTFSYGQQFAGNGSEAANVINLYRDPYGYVDTQLGLVLDGSVDMHDRWPIQQKMMNMNKIFKFPDGSSVALHDTHYTKANTVDAPIKEEYLKNLEMGHFGFYNMKHGNTEEAQQINLKFPILSEGLPYSAGHYHGDFLGISMWSAGMEVLPDGGYVFTPAANRYIHMNAYLHNCSWISSPQTPSYGALGTRTTRPNLLGYDDGSRSDKQIQLVEGSQPMTAPEGIDFKRRLVMMIATDENHSYTLDIQRMKGGTIHENFLRQVEEEDVDFTTDLNLPEAASGKIGNWLTAIGRSGGIVAADSALTSPRGVETNEDYSFSWRGKDSGTTLNVFMKGNPGTAVAFSEFPTMRRVNNVVADKDKYPGMHMYQRVDVSPNDTTMFGGVYEAFRSGETARVKGIEWLQPEDKDPMSIVAKVDLGDSVDYVYVSGDNKERQFEGMTFSGNYAALRKEKDSGKVVWTYFYGAGSIDAETVQAQGGTDYLFKVLGTQGSDDGVSVPNQIKVRGSLPESVKGLWGHSVFGDTSGFGYQVLDVDQSTVTVQMPPGFVVTDKGAEMTHFPRYEDPKTGQIQNKTGKYSTFTPRVIAGDAWFELKVPVFKTYQ
ncbi:MAG: copper amine oxidase N-terminal domain-containing protein [Clostridia bacterium]|nr:copper amine oxidase N-terminal domain-containing protein [Clostridia bacterium]